MLNPTLLAVSHFIFVLLFCQVQLHSNPDWLLAEKWLATILYSANNRPDGYFSKFLQEYIAGKYIAAY